MRHLAFAALLALAACQTPCPAQTSSTRTADFVCTDGSDIRVTFSHGPDFANIVQEGYAPVQLPQRPTASGYRYAAGGAELRGRGVEVRWTRPGADETLCREAQPAS